MNELSKCVICGRNTERMGCIRCQHRTGLQLREMVEYLAMAAGELMPGRGGSDGRGSEISLGVRINALDFLAGNDVLPILESWERDFRSTYGLNPYGPASAARNAGKPIEATTVGVVSFLIMWLDRAFDDHPAIDDFAAEVKQCHQTAQNAARMQPPSTTTITCPADDDSHNSGLCGYRMIVRPGDTKAATTCRRCGTRWDIPHLIHVAIATPGANIWVDVDTAADYFGLTARRIQQVAKTQGVKRRGGQYDLHGVFAALNLLAC